MSDKEETTKKEVADDDDKSASKEEDDKIKEEAKAIAKEAKDLTLVEQAQADEVSGKGGTPPPGAVRPKNNDILFGRGKPFQNHPGNRKMLGLIDQYKQQYAESPRDRKRPIVEEIIGMLTQDGGRFLKRYNEDVNSNWWMEVPRQVAFDKVSHAFRSRSRPKQDKAQAAAMQHAHHAAMSQHHAAHAHHAAMMPPPGAPHHGHAGYPPHMMGANFMAVAAMGRGMMGANPAMFRGYMGPPGPGGHPPPGPEGGGEGQGGPPPHGSPHGHGGSPHHGPPPPGYPGAPGSGHPPPPHGSEMEAQMYHRAAAFGYPAAAALYGAGFAGPGDGGFGMPPPGAGYPPPPHMQQQGQGPPPPPGAAPPAPADAPAPAGDEKAKGEGDAAAEAPAPSDGAAKGGVLHV